MASLCFSKCGHIQSVLLHVLHAYCSVSTLPEDVTENFF